MLALRSRPALPVLFLAPLSLLASAPAVAGTTPSDPFADAVVSFEAGIGGVPGYDDPSAALGSPERFTGEGLFPSVVSPFSPPFGIDEIVSIGAGGHLVVAFDEPVLDDPSNPFGIDLLVFGNAGCIDGAFPDGLVDGFFGIDAGTIEVSDDGVSWITVDGGGADDLFPTLGFLDSGPYDDVPGAVPADFTLPVDPSLSARDLLGLDHAALVALYAGSGGGTGIDLASTGLPSISFVRITPQPGTSVEIDAIADAGPSRTSADLDGDGAVNGADLGILLADWGGSAADLDGNGVVDGADLGALLAAWTGG